MFTVPPTTYSPTSTPSRSIEEICVILDGFNQKIKSLQQQSIANQDSVKQKPSQPKVPIYPHQHLSKPLANPRHTHQSPTPPFQPEPLLREIDAVVPFALAKSTRVGYNAAVRRFLEYCDSRNIPAHLRFPTDEVVLSNYAASFAHRLAGSSAGNAIAALKTWHALNNAPWNGGPRLSYMLKAVSKLAPPSSHRPLRPGVSIEHMDALAADLAIQTPKDAAVFAAAALAFWGIVRIGELLGTSRRIHRPNLFPSRSSLSGHPSDQTPLYLHLPCTKTSQITGATIRILRQQGPSNPIQAISNLLQVNNTIGPDDHLFAYRLTPTSQVRCLTKEEFITRCNDIWLARGLGRLTGHNFRIGGANTFIDAGVPSDIVKTIGRWKSGAYYKYWRKPEDKATHFAECIPIPVRHADRSRTGQGRLAPPAGAA